MEPDGSLQCSQEPAFFQRPSATLRKSLRSC